MAFLTGKPCQMTKQTVMAGLKCPPETDAEVMMAKAIPKPKAKATLRMDPKTAAFDSDEFGSAAAMMAKNCAAVAAGGQRSGLGQVRRTGLTCDTGKDVEEDACGLCREFAKGLRTPLLVREPFRRRRRGSYDLPLEVLLGGLCHSELQLARPLPPEVI